MVSCCGSVRESAGGFPDDKVPSPSVSATRRNIPSRHPGYTMTCLDVPVPLSSDGNRGQGGATATEVPFPGCAAVRTLPLEAYKRLLAAFGRYSATR